MGKFQAIFSIAVGVAICGIWGMLLATGSVADLAERPLLIITHIVSEFLTAGFLLFGGISFLRKKSFALRVFLVAQGLLMYSALNAGAYYAQSGPGMQAAFFAIFGLSLALVLLAVIKKGRAAKQH